MAVECIQVENIKIPNPQNPSVERIVRRVEIRMDNVIVKWEIGKNKKLFEISRSGFQQRLDRYNREINPEAFKKGLRMAYAILNRLSKKESILNLFP